MDKYQNLLIKLITPCLSQPEELFFDAFTQRINDHYDTLDTSKIIQINNIKNKNKDKGDFFEYISLRLIQLQAFKQIKCHQAWLFKDIPQEWREYFKFTQRDMGIDIIVQTVNNEFLAIQCKYKKKSRHTRAPNGAYIKHQIGWKNLATFYGLCDRTGPIGGWNKHIVITTASSVNRQGRQNNKDLNICLGTFRGLSKDVWFQLIGENGHKLTDKVVEEKIERIDVEEVRNKRLKFLEGLEKK